MLLISPYKRSLTIGTSGKFTATRRLYVSAQPLYTRPVSRDSMAQPTADPDGNIRDKKLTSEESRWTPGYKETSAETSPSRTNAEDTGVVSIRSPSERENSEITSSADETASLSILSHSATADEVQTSVRSTPDGEVAAAGAPSCSDDVKSVEASVSASPSVQAHYYVKWITWKGEKTPIITQSENGPCPLLAIMNILFLRWKAKLPPQTEVITIDELMAHLGECVLCIKPQENADGMELNFQQNMSDVMAVLPKLSTGLDVNVRFTGVADFEYTPECIVFDLLDVPLYHGWLVDPQSLEMASAVGKLTYNQLVEKIIVYKHSTDSNQVSEGLIAEQFLESTATQLTYHGLCELNTTANEGELCVFFRNNHFSTMNKHKGHLYLLVTDQGFLQEDTVVWESLHNVEGDGNFCDSGFRLSHPSQKSAGKPLTQQQIDQQTRGSQASHPGGRRRQAEKKDTSDCSIL